MLKIIKNVANIDVENIEKQRENCSHVSNIECWDQKLRKINLNLPLNNLRSQFESLHFELDVMSNIVNRNKKAKLFYEPIPIDKKGKNCDLIVETENKSYLVECKHFTPESKKRRVENQYFPNNFTVDLDEETFYHDFTLRGKLLNIIGDVEDKIKNYENFHTNVLAVSTGFYLDWPRLMYVAFFYSNLQFHPFDYLAKLTNNYMREKNIVYSQCINEFWSCHQRYGFIDKISMLNTNKGSREPLII